MAPEALPPNPVAPRAVSNDISLLLASKANRLRNSALFRKISSTSPSKPSASSSSSSHIDPAREESSFTPGGQNNGIGYTPSSSDKTNVNDAASSLLRNKLLGKRKGRSGELGAGKGRGGQESEEDEDEGRSGLGKRKKAKKPRIVEEEEEEVKDEAPTVNEALTVNEAPHTDGGDEDSRCFEKEEVALSSLETGTGGQTQTTKAKKKRKKAKNKNNR